MNRGALSALWIPLSLRLKLTLGYALIFSLSVMLGAAGVYLSARSTLSHALDAGLSETASVAQASIEREAGGYLFAPDLKPSGDLYVELLSAQGRRVAFAGTADPAELGGQAPVRPPVPGFKTSAQRRILTQALSGGLYLRLSRPSDTLSEVTETLGRILLVGSLGMIVLACAAGYVLADRALRPVDSVARTARRIADSGRYGERVPSSPGTDEMAVLTTTVNRMLDQMAATIEREKSFARTAAHELRTPLTSLKGRLDLALERPRNNEAYLKTLSVMRSRVNALVALSEGLLELARTDAPVQLAHIELGSVVLDAAEGLRGAFRAQGRRLHLDIEESWVQAEMPGLAQLVENLIGNALKYGGEQVQVRVSAGTLSVHDDGSGPERRDWERLLRPFERGAGLQAVPGSGLGLALVQALTVRWNARLEPVWEDGGFSLDVVWPGPH